MGACAGSCIQDPSAAAELFVIFSQALSVCQHGPRDMYSARDVLSKEELEFLLSAQPDEDFSDDQSSEGQDAFADTAAERGTQKAWDRKDDTDHAEDAGTRHPPDDPDELEEDDPDSPDSPDEALAAQDNDPAVLPGTGDRAKPDSGRDARSWQSRAEKANLDRDEVGDVGEDDLDEEQAAVCTPLEQKAHFFASLLERELIRRTGGLIALDVADISVMAQERLFGMLEEPASYTLLTGLPLARRLLFYCDMAVTAGLADASLGAGHALAPSRRPLSFLDLELVRRCLNLVPLCLAQAFDVPCCSILRHGQYADDIFLTRQEHLLHVVTLSMDLEGVRGASILAIPLR